MPYLYYAILYHTMLYYAISYYALLRCAILYYAIPILYYTTIHCSPPQHLAAHLRAPHMDS